MAHTHATTGQHSGARIYTIVAFVFAFIAIFFLPPLFGLVGLVLGIVGALRGDKPLGWYAAAASVVGAVIGLIIGYALLHH
ncbi:hypothetical protein [Micromonospora eburnea]|uniref:DUF4190 domain-containing protein n=1 Tax=Micromonospora eburnea TaxID=227316 RepID=A0A1C6TZU4_9ACTN|nr:hypothetical protein [Micromonospora eburnea]SCL47168.1 hypothetical protein GA0070604_1432 [Micromonospora eburnea]